MAFDPTTEMDSSGDGTPVVLIHGLGLDRFLWDPYVAPMAGQCRVIRYDLLGHGAAPPLVAPPTMADFDAQLLDVLDSLDIPRVVLIGFSLGGIIARSMAVRHPDRVSGLVMLNTITGRPRNIKEQVMDRARRLDLGEDAPLVAEAIERWFTAGFREERTDVIDGVVSRLERNNPESYRHAYRFFAEVDGELPALHPSIEAPALVLTCDDDRKSTPEMARSIAEEIPLAEWHSLPDLRHMGLVERPSAMIEYILPFIQRLGDGAG